MDAARVPGRCHSDLPSASPDGGGAVSAVSRDVRHQRDARAGTGLQEQPHLRTGGAVANILHISSFYNALSIP
jgi:hypothetical protein